MPLLQMTDPLPPTMVFGQGNGSTLGMDIGVSSSAVEEIGSPALYDGSWAYRLAAALGIEAAREQLEGVPEQLIFIAEMVLNNAATFHLQGVRQHALELKALATRFGSLPLAFAALSVAHHDGIPPRGVLQDLLLLAHTVSASMRAHLMALNIACCS